MSTSIDREAARIAVLCAVAEAAREAAREMGWLGAEVTWVANALGRHRPDLLNTRRERLMSELRRDGLVAYRQTPDGGRWSVTPAGAALLEAQQGRGSSG